MYRLVDCYHASLCTSFLYSYNSYAAFLVILKGHINFSKSIWWNIIFRKIANICPSSTWMFAYCSYKSHDRRVTSCSSNVIYSKRSDGDKLDLELKLWVSETNRNSFKLFLVLLYQLCSIIPQYHCPEKYKGWSRRQNVSWKIIERLQ